MEALVGLEATSTVMSSAPMQTGKCKALHCAIVGGGIVGASAAYYLKLKGVHSTVIEQTDVACHSSGKAGGFLSKAMPQGTIAELSSYSFGLHQELAEKMKAKKTGYRAMKCISLGHGKKPLSEPGWQWLDQTNGRVHSLGNETDTAQVHPRLLTHALMAESCAKVVHDQVVNVAIENGTVTGVETKSGVKIDCDYLLVAMGAWSHLAVQWFPQLAKILPCNPAPKYTSIVLKSVVDNTAVFMSTGGEVEIYPRGDETYVCGCPSQIELPKSATQIVPEEADVEFLKKECGKISSKLANAPVVQTQSCCLPLAADGLPVIGKIPQTENALIATGLGCWGILNGPATGKAVAEIVSSGKVESFDCTPFSPSRRDGLG